MKDLVPASHNASNLICSRETSKNFEQKSEVTGWNPTANCGMD